MGEDAILRGEVVVPARKVNVQHGIQFSGYGHGTVASNGDLVVEKSIATILKSDNPKVGDRLQHPDGDYDLDVLHKDNGVTMQFILRKHVV